MPQRVGAAGCPALPLQPSSLLPAAVWHGLLGPHQSVGAPRCAFHQVRCPHPSGPCAPHRKSLWLGNPLGASRLAPEKAASAVGSNRKPEEPHKSFGAADQGDGAFCWLSSSPYCHRFPAQCHAQPDPPLLQSFVAGLGVPRHLCLGAMGPGPPLWDPAQELCMCRMAQCLQ